MSNTLITIDMVTREALRVAHENLAFIGTVDRQYDSSYGVTGAKIGSALRVRKPNQYVRTTGSRVMDVQDQAEATSTITLATQDHVDMRFNSAELSLTIDEISKRYIEPAVKVLVSGIEADFLAYATKATWNTVGTAGTAITDLEVPGYARARLNTGLAPKDGNRAVQLDSVTGAKLVNGLKGLFHDGSQIKEQYREGMLGRTAMADWYENDRIWSMANATDVAATLNSYTVIDGDADLTVNNFATPNAGMVCTIAGVYACHPETKQSLGYLQQFTLLAGSTSTNLLISPTIYLTGARQNVCSSTGGTAAPTTTAAVTFVGSASTNYPAGLMYHKEAFQFVTADLPLMDDAHKCVRRMQDGLSLRVWQASDIRNDELLMRIDILYGFAALRPEWASRMIGSAAA